MASTLYDYSSDIAEQRQRRKRLQPRDTLVRAAVCELTRREFGVGTNKFESVESVIARRYSGCAATLAYIQRTAVAPAQTSVPGWAQELVSSAVVNFISEDMARTSAFAQLAEKALLVNLEPGTGVAKIPARSSPLSLMGQWVSEAAAKPIFPGSFVTADLVPYKLSAISTYSEEMAEHSAIEQIVTEMLRHDLGCLLDSSLLDSTAASATRPAGLFNSATAVTPSALTPANEAAIADLRGLGAAVSSNNADARLTYVCNPAQKLRLDVLSPGNENVISSGFMPINTVGCLDCSALAMMIGAPSFRISRDAALHMETSPLPLATGPQGSAVMAAPTRSLFQENLVGLRVVLHAGWTIRRSDAAALATSVIW